MYARRLFHHNLLRNAIAILHYVNATLIKRAYWQFHTSDAVNSLYFRLCCIFQIRDLLDVSLNTFEHDITEFFNLFLCEFNLGDPVCVELVTECLTIEGLDILNELLVVTIFISALWTKSCE